MVGMKISSALGYLHISFLIRFHGNSHEQSGTDRAPPRLKLTSLSCDLRDPSISMLFVNHLFGSTVEQHLNNILFLEVFT